MRQADIGKLGKYEVLGELGKGAMGVVYKGKDPFIERHVALKTVRTDMLAADDPEATTAQITRFKREAQAAGRINHPNIVAIYEYGEDGPTAFIAMEFIQGRDLKEYFDAHERFDIKSIVRIMTETLSALDYAHKHGIVHRDIKPANIMMTADGEVKITDFGIARLESSNLTQAGTVMGTPSYMSPEQFMGQQVDNRSDIFSAGAVFYQLLTGEKPFTGSLTTIMHRVLHSQPEAPSLLNVQIPRGFDQVVAKAMAKRPEDRYPSAADFAQAIREAAEGRLSAPKPAEDEAERTIGDNDAATVVLKARPAASGQAANEVMPARGLAGEAVIPERAPGHGSAANRTHGGSNGILIGAIAGGVLVVGGIAGWLALGSGSDSGGKAPPPPVAERVTPGVPALPAPPSADDVEAARAREALAEAKRQAEAKARRQIEEERRIAEERAAQQAEQAKREAEARSANEARRQADEQAAAEAKREAEAQAQARIAATEAKRAADETARRQQLALGPVRSALTQAPCALLKADIGSDGGLMVTGAMGAAGPDTPLRTLIETAAPGVPYILKVDAMSPLMCEPLEATSRLRQRNTTLDQPTAVLPNNPSAIYKNGQNLILDVTAPGYPAYLQVDYFTLEGYVVHLFPNGLEKDHKLTAGSQRRLGDPTKGGRFWTVGQPFGRELIVVTATAKPLFSALRPEAEQATGYLTALHKALETTAKGTGPAPVTAALIITTVPN